MAAESIWHATPPGDPSAPPEILHALLDAGLKSHGLVGSSTRTPGILFFRRADPQLIRLISDLSAGGVGRLVAVALDPACEERDWPWQLLGAGASDVLTWGEGTANLLAAKVERWNEIDRLAASPLVRENLVGKGPAWTNLLRQVIEIAAFTDRAVLLQGETGTGKELVARLIHALDARRPKGELVVVDSTNLTPELGGSELFGHERGSFTGAVGSREGAFALANGGTLFMDEVGELPPQLQAQLLRVLQERTYKRVGGNTWQKTEFRLICATNRDLQSAVRLGKFRRDLYYRIAGATCRLPSLKDRVEDIPPLVSHFLSEFGVSEVTSLDVPISEFLIRREYPGNVRELRLLIARMLARHVGPVLTVGDLPEDERPRAIRDGLAWRSGPFEQAVGLAVGRGASLREISRAAADTAIRCALAQEGGNLRRAARRLGVTDRALQLRRAPGRARPGGNGAEEPIHGPS